MKKTIICVLIVLGSCGVAMTASDPDISQVKQRCIYWLNTETAADISLTDTNLQSYFKAPVSGANRIVTVEWQAAAEALAQAAGKTLPRKAQLKAIPAATLAAWVKTELIDEDADKQFDQSDAWLLLISFATKLKAWNPDLVLPADAKDQVKAEFKRRKALQ